MKSEGSALEYISSTGQWEEALMLLRGVFLEAGMVEHVKWGIPVYTHKGRNLTGMAVFKAYAGIWFYQGAFLSDPGKKLMNAQEGKTRALRQWRFSSPPEVWESLPLVLQYTREAMLNCDREMKIKPDRNQTFEIPEEMEQWLASDGQLKECFGKLSAARQREYAEYITTARQDKTRVSRMVKVFPLILNGSGLYDKYKKTE